MMDLWQGPPTPPDAAEGRPTALGVASPWALFCPPAIAADFRWVANPIPNPSPNPRTPTPNPNTPNPEARPLTLLLTPSPNPYP